MTTPEPKNTEREPETRWEVPILVRCVDQWTAYATVAAPTADEAVARIKADPSIIYDTLELVKEVNSESQEFDGIRDDVDVRKAEEQPHGI